MKQSLIVVLVLAALTIAGGMSQVANADVFTDCPVGNQCIMSFDSPVEAQVLNPATGQYEKQTFPGGTEFLVQSLQTSPRGIRVLLLKVQSSGMQVIANTTVDVGTVPVDNGQQKYVKPRPASNEAKARAVTDKKYYITTTLAWYRTFQEDDQGQDFNPDNFYGSIYGTYYFYPSFGMTALFAKSYGEVPERGLEPGAWRLGIGPSFRFLDNQLTTSLYFIDDIYKGKDGTGHEHHLVLNPNLSFGIWDIWTETVYEWNTRLDNMYFRIRSAYSIPIGGPVLDIGPQFDWIAWQQPVASLAADAEPETELNYISRAGAFAGVKFYPSFWGYMHPIALRFVILKPLIKNQKLVIGTEISFDF